MTANKPTTCSFGRTSRRGLLKGLGMAAGGSLAAGLVQNSTAAATQHPHVTDAPVGDGALDQRQSFLGQHQAGIVTPRPAAGMIAAFDVLVDDPADLERLLRTLTGRVAFLTRGGATPEFDPKLPPADSGILGPVVMPNNLTVTVSLGASLFSDRAWLSPFKPNKLVRMTKFPNDALDRSICHGDLALQLCANSQDTTIHALRDIIKSMADLMVLRWKQEGTVPVVRPNAGGTVESARNFLGFRDGTANPDSGDAQLMDRVVWVDAHNGEPKWASGGSYQVVRVIRNFVERWDRTPLGEQERIIGRLKASGAPFDGKHESDQPAYVSDPGGKVTPLDAHIRLANPRTPGSEQNLILRRPFNYSNGVSKSGQLDQGLLFICYQADIDKGFVAVQRRLDGEPLEEYLKPVGGGYFYALPGVFDSNDYLGRRLVEVAAANASMRSNNQE